METTHWFPANWFRWTCRPDYGARALSSFRLKIPLGIHSREDRSGVLQRQLPKTLSSSQRAIPVYLARLPAVLPNRPRIMLLACCSLTRAVVPQFGSFILFPG